MNTIGKTDGQSALPITPFVPKIKERVRNNQVTILVGETGSGKSTVIPQALAEDARRCRQAYENGPVAGYRVMNDKRDEHSDDVYSTTGYLIEWLSHNEDVLDSVSHIILDESHERSIDMDLLSLLIKRYMLRKGPDHHIRLVIMSATLDIALYRTFFTLMGVVPLPHIFVADCHGICACTNKNALPEAFVHGSYMVESDFKTINAARAALASTLLTGNGLITGSLRPYFSTNIDLLALNIKSRDPKDIKSIINAGGVNGQSSGGMLAPLEWPKWLHPKY
ncbi:hypothetical protein SmJEL517_g03127 [Synchytrium microbalum]|uniref:Helicase ATP-binding domain-containing protein n=1 Tax=Synchytrium microbalum TaxID=1806994 RepID=A0A507C872_9FUNG|nr:uncharacterized protein SmJEL517_g03127 [Synchytrium microbalum]TPX34214.1 hypothetical protein SmJEL517_g03127 [Synchytrium microbalum]